jgi:hypothetical protein
MGRGASGVGMAACRTLGGVLLLDVLLLLK